MKRAWIAGFFCALTAAAGVAAAQTTPSAEADPVAHARAARGWEYGPFVAYGNGVGDREDFKFLMGGVQAGKILTPVVKAGPLSGQFELGANVMPLWQAYTPAAHTVTETCTANGVKYSCTDATGGGTYRGVSVTPVIFRWNFVTRSRRIQPWFQAAGGLIYTTKQFPPNFLSDPARGLNGSTSVWNFSPQGGLGLHYFTSARRSIDFGVNAVHISSASLGDKNPGVNASMQFQVGYTFWK